MPRRNYTFQPRTFHTLANSGRAQQPAGSRNDCNDALTRLADCFFQIEESQRYPQAQLVREFSSQAREWQETRSLSESELRKHFLAAAAGVSSGTFDIHSIDSRASMICVCLQSRDICMTRHSMNAASTAAAPRIPTFLRWGAASSCVKYEYEYLPPSSVLVTHDDSPHHSRPWHQSTPAKSNDGRFF